MSYLDMVMEINKYINDSEYDIYLVKKIVQELFQCIDLIDKNHKVNCEEFYAGTYESLDDDLETLIYLKEFQKDFVAVNKKVPLKIKEEEAEVKQLINLLATRKINS